MTSLRELPIGKTATIRSVGGEGALRQHFLDMGLIPKGDVTMVKYAPMGDPMELRIHSYELTLRLADAEKIEIENIRDEVKPYEGKAVHKKDITKAIPHPGLGEGGKYHEKENEHPLPDSELLTFALAGNQNCGKTTLFNQLTGSSQHVGNFPGVTVDRKDGMIRGRNNTLVTDLPGIYSMSPYSSEEIVTRNFVLDEHPKGIINIVDATNIERNLYLTMQLMELDIPMVLALNMMDEVRENGGSILVNRMEKMLGIPVVPISAAKNEGIDELVAHALHVAKYQEKPQNIDFCDANEDGGAVHRCLHAIMHLIEDHAQAAEIPVRFAAAKLAEGDQLIMDSLKLDQNEKEMLEHIIQQMEKERGLDRAAAIAHMRFDFIERVCDETVVKPKESKEHLRSVKIDRILTGKYTAIPCFVGIMGLVFFLTFSVIGAFFQNLLEMGITALGNFVDNWMTSAGVNDVLHSLVIDGVFNGVGSVLSFLPVIVTLFFFLSLLEDSGYMARVAFVMDKLLRKIGLSGRSIVPMLVGFGCTVPGVMASRTIENERDRHMTIMTTCFIPCGAKMPIIGLFAGALFGGSGLVAVSAYFIGVAAIVISGIMLKKTKPFAGEVAPFVMELPAYHIPTAGSVLRATWERGWSFIKRAGTVIVASSVVLWFLQGFGFVDGAFGMVEDNNSSLLATIGGAICWIFAPLGFGDWQSTVATITGLIAKENVVSTFGVLFGGFSEVAENGDEVWGQVALHYTQLTAYSFMVFNLLCAPCFAAMGAIKREMNNQKWFWAAIGYMCGFAYIVSMMIYQFGSLFTGNVHPVGLIVAIIELVFIIYMLARKNPYVDEATGMAKKSIA